ncbi:hypothetical protein HN873_023944, partial [Arachis hypogaea]
AKRRRFGFKKEKKRKAYALTKPNPNSLSSPITPITANLPFLLPSPTKATIATAHQPLDSRNYRATHSHLQQQRSSFATHNHLQQQRSSFATQTNPHRVEPASSSPKVTELTEPASSFTDEDEKSNGRSDIPKMQIIVCSSVLFIGMIMN